MLLSGVNVGCAQSIEDVPAGFVNVAEINSNIYCDARYFSSDNFIGQPIDGYLAANCLISVEAATALKNVSDELKPLGLGLKVFDAYRPQRAVDHFVRWAKDLDDIKMKAQYYPDVDKKHLIQQGYIATKSGHSRGSTVDLTIVDSTRDSIKPQELDMGTAWDYFSPRSWPSSMDVTVSQRANRLLLQTLMAKHGFKSLQEEWWHFTLNNEPYLDSYFDFEVR